MDDFEAEIKTEFLNEALINLEEVESSFMELESASDPKPLLDKIFRLAHNLKGGSRAVGFGVVAEFTHQLESLVLKLQKGEIALSSDVITTLLRSNDRLVEMLTELKSNGSANFDNQDILTEIQRWLSGATVVNATPTVPEASVMPEAAEALAAVATEPVALAEEAIAEAPPAVPSADTFFQPEESKTSPSAEPAVQPAKPVKAEPKQAGPKEDEIVRVSLSKIDLLNDYVGELIVLQSVIQQQSLGTSGVQLQASIRQMVKLSKDIQNLSMSLRMLPVKPLIQKLQRVVRDTAKVLGKEVELNLIGEGMDIDKSVLDRLADPLIHILRNAVDHGLEMPSDREKAGKDRQGQVQLAFMHEGNHLVIEVKDDGKGINGEVLLKKAIERKLVAEGQSLTEKQLIHLIFHPGFSTKAETSEISGRGVGMDVVKTNVEKIGGHVDITTAVGKGSTFRLQIPLSLAVIEGLVVTSETNRFVVPLSQVQETINIRSQKVFADKIGVGPCFELRGQVVPMVKVDDALHGRNSKGALEGTALIVHVEDRPIALVVRDILRAQQIVIKPFGNGITPQRGWVGSCVLGDGLPTLIVSPTDLLVGRVIASQGEQALGGVA